MIMKGLMRGREWDCPQNKQEWMLEKVLELELC